MRKSLWVTLVFSSLLATTQVFASEARVYAIKLTNAAEIKSDSDHFDIIFVAGWVSKRDDFFTSLLSSTSKAAAAISATGTYFDGDQLKNAWVVENSDVGNKLDRPWGIANKELLSGIPADTVIANITVQFELHKEDRIKQILGIVKGAEPVAGATVQPYLTYATLIDNIFSSFFGTDKTRYPFLMNVGLTAENVKSSNGMFEHYLVGISPNKDGDTWLNALDGSKLAFNESGRDLTYDGQQVADHTYAVFLVRRAVRPDIRRLLFTSKAPWSVLALSTFYQAPFPRVTKTEDIAGFENQYIKNLTDCVDLLKRELRFSAFDRALALYAFAERARTMIAAGCKSGAIVQDQCKTPQLIAYEDGIKSIFPLMTSSSKLALSSESIELNQRIQIDLKLDMQKTPPKQD